MYKWVQEPGVVARFMERGGGGRAGAEQTSIPLHVKEHVKLASTN